MERKIKQSKQTRIWQLLKIHRLDFDQMMYFIYKKSINSFGQINILMEIKSQDLSNKQN